MKKGLSILVIGILVLGVALSGCEQKSDAEKALDGLKKDVKGLTK